MAKKGKDYFKLDRVVSIILAIIPVTAFFCGAITRFQEKHYLAGVLRILLGWNIVWLLDLILICLKGEILRIL